MVDNLDDSDQTLKLHLGNCFLTTVQLSKIENREISKSDNLESLFVRSFISTSDLNSVTVIIIIIKNIQ